MVSCDRTAAAVELNRSQFENASFVGHLYQRDVSGMPDRPAGSRTYETSDPILTSV